mmetsp:Transcript_30106/g.70199  ORF Transcript_30106/g.70199 Transcript_30106/m.70199 type:complete len:590 (+) Transcript_30106:141-1910(+)
MSYAPVRSSPPSGHSLNGPYDQFNALNTQTQIGEEITTLWIGNARPGTSDAELAHAFRRFGPLVCCFLLKKLSAQGNLNGFVRFHTLQEATEALNAVQSGVISVNGATLAAKWAQQNSKPLSEKHGIPSGLDALEDQAFHNVNMAAPAVSADGEEITTLWIGNAVRGTSDADLAAAFMPFGELVCCFLLKKLSSHGNMSGFVRFPSRQEASLALEAVCMGDIKVKGATLTAKWASQNSQPMKNPPSTSAPQQVQPPSQQAAATQWKSKGHSDGLATKMPQPRGPGGSDMLDRAVQVLQTAVQSIQSTGRGSSGQEEITTLWIGNATPSATDNMLSEAFGVFGNMLACFLLPKLSPNGQKSGFVRYAQVGEAEYALSEVEAGRVQIHGVPLTAKWASRNSSVSESMAGAATDQVSALETAASLLTEPGRSGGKGSDATTTALSALSHAMQVVKAAKRSAPGADRPLDFNLDEGVITTLWIGNAVPGTTDEELTNGFRRYGQLVCCFLLKKLSPNGNMSGFVRFATRPQAARALDAVSSGDVAIRGSILTAKWASQNSKPLADKMQALNAPAPWKSLSTGNDYSSEGYRRR